MAATQHKLRITPDMGAKIKDFRNMYKVKAKELAEVLGKSGAYISKLEKGEIHYIEKQEFIRMVDYITKTQDGYNTFFEYVSSLLNSKDLENSVMFLNYDWCERLLPISEKLRKYLNDKIEKNSISINDLVEYINENEELDDAFCEEQKIDKKTVEVNTWMIYREVDSSAVQRNYIFVHLSDEEVGKIVKGVTQKTTYLKIYAILYHIYKIEKRREKIMLNSTDFVNMKKKTEKKLSDLKFYTVTNKKMLLEKATEEELLDKDILSSYDLKNYELINNIIENFIALSEYDVDYMNKKLEGISNNLDKVDASFVVAYMALSLEALADKSFEIKKEFLASVTNLISKCASMANNEFEKY